MLRQKSKQNSFHPCVLERSEELLPLIFFFSNNFAIFETNANFLNVDLFFLNNTKEGKIKFSKVDTSFDW